MLFKSIVGISVIAVSVVVAGCNRPAQETRDEAKETAAKVADATVEAQRQRDAEVSRLRRAVQDVGSDVRRLAGNVAEPVPVATDTPATAPFTSRRDAFVTATKGRVNTFRRALDPVKANGPREAELKDTKARVEKMAEDLDKLARASADDWWDVSKDRVEAYLDRVEASVKRLDDHQPRTE